MTRRQQAIDTALAWLALAVAYRLPLERGFWAGAWQDVLVALAVAALAVVVAGVSHHLLSGLMAGLLLLAGIEAQACGRILVSLRMPLDWPMLRDALQSDEWQTVRLATLGDVVAILTPVVLWLGLRTVSAGHARVRPVALVLALATLGSGWLWAPPLADDLPPHAERPPLLHLLLTDPPPEDVSFETPPLEPALVLPAPVTPTPLPAPATAIALPAPATQPYNVVWIVMESTGTRYVEGQYHRDPPPMPFLHQLMADGWHLTRHQSPSNSSATSIFAQLSGLLPSPETAMFATRADNWVQALPAYLPATYERFLYTPGRLNFFFPQAFLRHSGLTDMVGYDETVVKKNVGVERMSKDEIETVTTFLDRLKRAHEPFLGIYYSFSPHWPYTDYGPAWRRYKGDQPLDHYHNALWLLDNQIRRIADELRAQGRLDHTILVLAGDHGEAFGQHPHNWAHSKGSYQENFETPAVLWQPKIFAPRTVTQPTSHVDLLPTLLDALGLPFDRSALQGVSLWQPVPSRHLYAWSNEGMATVTTPEGIKLTWHVTDGRCRVHDLVADPQEKQPRKCDAAPELWAELKAWVAQQPGRVRRASEARRK